MEIELLQHLMIFFFRIRLIKDVIALAAQPRTSETVDTTSAILAKPYVAALGTIAGKERFIALIAVNTVITELTILTVDHIHALLAVV